MGCRGGGGSLARAGTWRPCLASSRQSCLHGGVKVKVTTALVLLACLFALPANAEDPAQITYGPSAGHLWSAGHELESKSRIISKSMINLNDSKQIIEIPVKEEYRGNISVHLEFIKHNRSYTHDEIITVPYTNKQLDISFETFRNKLYPGQNEEWKAIIKDKKGAKVAAEMVASLYDASLDAFRVNKWDFNIYQSYYSTLDWQSENAFGTVTGQVYSESSKPQVSGFRLRNYDRLNWFGYNVFGYGYYGFHGGVKSLSSSPMMMKAMNNDNEVTLTASEKNDKNATKKESKKDENKDMEGTQNQTPSNEVMIRKNFNETAFFFPALQTNDKGEISFKFTMPDALTRWKLLGLAYTKDLKYGLTEKEVGLKKN
jgi:hypothetical protein